MSQLSTDWLCIATEGDTVDGRYITRQSLIDAAETYDPQLYAALIWPEHDRTQGNLGEVLATRWEEDEAGLVRLLAKIKPNVPLIEANQKNQLIYFSVELTEGGNFRGTGRDYLQGLGATNSPASVGTTRLTFSRQKKSTPGYYPYFFNNDGTVKQGQNKHMSNWQKLFGINTQHFQKEEKQQETQEEITHPPPEENKLQTLAEALNRLEERVSNIESALNQTQSDINTIADVVDTEAFSLLRKNIGKVMNNFTKLDEAVTALPKYSINNDTQPRKFTFI